MNDCKRFVVRCRAIILHEGKLLVVRHAHDPSFAALPGGHLEWGEDVRMCLRREIVEELGIVPDIGRLLYVNTFIDARKQTQPTEFFFEVLNGREYLDIGSATRTHAHELSDVVWVSPADDVIILPQEMSRDFRADAILSDEVRYIHGTKV